MIGRLWWFITGGQADFAPLFANKYVNVLMTQYGGVNVAPAMELFILVCILGAALFVALGAFRLKQRRWVRACISTIASVALTTAAYAASTTLSNLSAGSAISGTDLFYDVQTAGTGGVKVTAAQLLTYINANVTQIQSVAGSCGNAASGGSITPSNPAGLINSQLVANVQTGTNYGIQTTDCGGAVVLSHSSNTTPTIPVAGSVGFGSGWYTTVCNVNTGTQTLTPASGTIAGLSSFTLAAGSVTAPVCIGIFSGSSVGSNDYGLIVGSAALPNPIPGGIIGTIRTSTSTAESLSSSDCGTDVRYTSNSGVTVTIPGSLSPGCHVNIIQRGTAKVTVTGSAVSPCVLTSSHSYTGTSGTAGSVIGIIIDATSTPNNLCVLTGDGS